MGNLKHYRNLFIGALLLCLNSLIIGTAVNYYFHYSLERKSISRKIDSLETNYNQIIKDKEVYFKASKQVNKTNKDSLILVNKELIKRSETYIKERVLLNKRAKHHVLLKRINYGLIIIIPLLICLFYYLGFVYLNRFLAPQKAKNEEALKE